MRQQRLDPAERPEQHPLRAGWRFGADDFPAWLADKLRRRGRASEAARSRRETDEQLAERLVEEGLRAAGWRRETLAQTAKGDAIKVRLAACLRTQTPMSRAWIAQPPHGQSQLPLSLDEYQ